jgi:DNA-binding beta-propeller fold protein YncE
VLKLSSEGKLLASFGEQGKPGEDATHFNKPTDVAFAPNGDVYVSDGYGNSRVVRFSHDGKYLGAWGKKGTGEGEFNLPHAVVVDRRGRVYVADRENARIQVFTPEGKFITQWRDTGHPYGLYLTPDERLFVTDGIAHTLSLFDLNGKRLGQYGMPGKGPGEFDLPHLLTVDGEGAVYVCEINGKRIQKLIRQ